MYIYVKLTLLHNVTYVLYLFKKNAKLDLVLDSKPHFLALRALFFLCSTNRRLNTATPKISK